MDEISYWVYTKRAPCLMNYDNVIRKQHEEAQCSKNDSKHVYEIVSPPKKRKKRQLSILDENSVSTEKQQNLYFEVSQNQKHIKPALESCESDTLGSDVEFNIKNTSHQYKRKKARLQKSSQLLHKKNKVVTSTPKAAVRRSLRQAQQHNTHLNSSFETFHASIVNGVHLRNNSQSVPKAVEPTKPVKLADDSQEDKKVARNKSKTAVIHNNGQFEDLSDVSGFTANYIRSTKMQANKTPRKLRCKNNKNLVKESQEDTNLVICLNKATNTGMAKNNTLNCSTDSSQNVLNLVTLKNYKTTHIDKTTSQLKFMDKKNKSKESLTKDKQKNKTNLNISFQSQSSGMSRYPKRNKHHNNVTDNGIAEHTQSTAKKRRTNKNCVLEFNNSDKKENPEEKVVTRARSGRNTGLAVCHRENSILVVSNSTEQVSTVASMNVATPKTATQKKKKRTRQTRTRKSTNKTDSLRDKSGFAACFSDSDNDSEPLKPRKYFCA